MSYFPGSKGNVFCFSEMFNFPFVKFDIFKWLPDKKTFYHLLSFHKSSHIFTMWSHLFLSTPFEERSVLDLDIQMLLISQRTTLSVHVNMIRAVWSMKDRHSSIKNKTEKLLRWTQVNSHLVRRLIHFLSSFCFLRANIVSWICLFGVFCLFRNSWPSPAIIREVFSLLPLSCNLHFTWPTSVHHEGSAVVFKC